MSQEPDRVSSGVAKVERERRRAECADVLTRAIADNRTNVTSLAHALGVPSTRIDDWRNPDIDRHVSVADAAGMPPYVRVALAEFVAGPGYAVTDLPAVEGDVSDDLRLACSTQRETSEAVSAHLAAISDGHVTREEGVSLERECDDAIRALLCVRELARHAVRHGVVGVKIARLRQVTT